jgi:hypothetical protein
LYDSQFSDKYSAQMKRQLQINFTDQIRYTVKKTLWQSGGECEIKFTEDVAVKSTTIKVNGKTAEVRVPPGLPSHTRPTARQAIKSTGYRQPQAKNVAKHVAPQFQQMSIQQQPTKSPAFANNQGTAPVIPNVAIQAAAKKKAPPPPPPAKKLPQCKALYVSDSKYVYKVGLSSTRSR